MRDRYDVIIRILYFSETELYSKFEMREHRGLQNATNYGPTTWFLTTRNNNLLQIKMLRCILFDEIVF